MNGSGFRFPRSVWLAAALLAAPVGSRPAAGAEPAPAAPEPKPKLAPERVRTLQMKEMKKQSTPHEHGRRRSNGFTRCLDDAHRRLYCTLDNAVRIVDLRWLAEDAPYEPELSTFRLRLFSRVGGRSSDETFDFKIRFRGDVALPGLERKLHLVLDNAGRDSLPGTDPMKKESDPRLGLTAMFKGVNGGDFSLGGGLKWRDSEPVAYVSLDWRWEQKVGVGQFCLNPRTFYYSDDGLGQQTVVTWTRQLGAKTYFQSRTAERTSESRDDVELEQSLRFAWLRSGKGRGWVAQGSVFPHIRSSDWYWDDSMVNLTWRDALYRKWIYYTITPQVQFPKEDEYEARPSLHVGLEILFGGKVGELL